MTIMRETLNYTCERSARGIRITAKAKGVTAKSRVVSLGLWQELLTYSDTEFDGACCLELGIGTFGTH